MRQPDNLPAFCRVQQERSSAHQGTSRLRTMRAIGGYIRVFLAMIDPNTGYIGDD